MYFQRMSQASDRAGTRRKRRLSVVASDNASEGYVDSLASLPLRLIRSHPMGRRSSGYKAGPAALHTKETREVSERGDTRAGGHSWSSYSSRNAQTSERKSVRRAKRWLRSRSRLSTSEDPRSSAD